jgi:hypothetical protein
MPNIAKLFPEESSGLPSREAIVRQLQETAQLVATLEPATLDEKLVELAEELRHRLAALMRT